jgi:hypothetical protein
MTFFPGVDWRGRGAELRRLCVGETLVGIVAVFCNFRGGLPGAAILLRFLDLDLVLGDVLEGLGSGSEAWSSEGSGLVSCLPDAEAW